MSIVEIEFPYLVSDKDRHGNPRLYVRRHGRKIRMREKRGTPEFARAYASAVEALEVAQGRKPGQRHTIAPHGSLGWLASVYFKDGQFTRLNPVSQTRRRSVIEECLREPIVPGSNRVMRDCPLAHVNAEAILMLRDRRQDKPGAANNRLKYLSAMFGWAIEARRINRNPCRDVKPIGYATDGFHTWTPDEVAQFEARHPVGTKPRLALALLLLLGVRRGDVVKLGRPHLRGELIAFVPSKTSYRRKDLSVKPILPELRAIMDATPQGELTFLTTSHGRPFTAAGFGNWFRERCNEAGLPQCSAHGLRKAGATRAADNGATEHQLMALFDWTTPAQAAVYTRKANRARLAADGIKLLATDQTENVKGPTVSVPLKIVEQ